MILLYYDIIILLLYFNLSLAIAQSGNCVAGLLFKRCDLKQIQYAQHILLKTWSTPLNFQTILHKIDAAAATAAARIKSTFL